MTRKIILIASLILVCVSVPALANDEERDYQRNYQRVWGPALRGLKGVWVGIEFSPPDIKEYGLTENRIRTDVEIKLRTAGIRVIPTIKELSKEPGVPWLYIAVHTIHHQKLGVFAFSVHVQLRQDVLLERDPTVKIGGITWETPDLEGIAGEQSVPQHILVDTFINAYLTENPKK